jgi:hypothetical protein
VPVPVAGRPPDSDAPPGSPPHWLPPDMWVHLHWVPFDEARLQSLLHASRSQLWRWLRNDARTLTQLGAQRGYPSPRRLAATLVAPRAKDVSAAMARELRARTLRVLVQGHLSQHLIFHSLHQEAGPQAAASLFGVRDTATFQRLRRLDLSPLRIGRTHGRTREQMQDGLERELRTAAGAGVKGGDTSARQARSCGSASCARFRAGSARTTTTVRRRRLLTSCDSRSGRRSRARRCRATDAP